MNGNNEKGVILVIDDDKKIEITKNLLNGVGYDTLTAVNKSEAIAAINAIRFDVVILEVNMLHGIDILKQIKAKKSKTKVIVYSRCDYETKKKAEEAGINEFLPKSAEISMLVDAVQHVLK